MRRPVAVALFFLAAFLPGCSSIPTVPACEHPLDSIVVLEAQSVRSSTLLPCFSPLPLGWTFSANQMKDGSSTFWFDSDRAGINAAQITLTATCDLSSALQVPPAARELPASAYERPVGLPPSFEDTRYLTFPGGCIAEHFKFGGRAPATLALEIEQSLSLVPRQLIVDHVKSKYGLTLCGAGAPPCAG